MRNSFSKAAKYFSKANRIREQHNGGVYYVTDGFAAMEVPAAALPLLTAECGFIQPCDDGTGLDIWTGKLETVPTKILLPLDKYFNQDDAETVTATHVSVTVVDPHKKPLRLSLFTGHGIVTALDEKKVDPFAEFAGKYITAKDAISPVVFSAGLYGVRFMVMPCKLSENEKQTFRAVAAALPTK